MSAPSPAVPLVCPACGRKYQGDPNRPTARYVCAVDRATLVRVADADSASLQSETTPEDTVLSGDPTWQVTTPMPTGDNQPTRPYSAGESPTVPFDSMARSRSQDLPTQPLTANAPSSSGSASPAAREGTSAATSALGQERLSVVSILRGGPQAAPELPKRKYELMGKLGQGGVGEVLKVYDCDLKREVAMKMLLRQGAGNDSLIRFVEEAQATGQLEHPNIVPVHDLGVDGDGRLYFTLKYVQGLSLKAVIRGRNHNERLPEGGNFRDRFTPMRMIETLVSMCQAVAYAHSKGIIHRDLKPDNIMLGKYGEVLVMDWGLAKVLGQKRDSGNDTVRITTSRAEDGSLNTLEGSIAGTPAYMSPEQAAGKISELDQRTDVYSLGAILYEILSGEPPYGGGSAMQVIRKVVDSPPPPLKQGVAGFEPLPRELKAICEKAMARNPQERYASAALLRDDLLAFLENEPVSAAPDNRWQRAAKWARRNRRQVQSGVLSGAAVLALLLTSWFGWRAWTIHSLLSKAQNKLEAAWTAKKDPRLTLPVNSSDPYRATMQADALREHSRVIRASVNAAIDPLRQVLEISPSNGRARLMLAEAYMELWRLALEEKNGELARATRRDVETYAPRPDPFATELNGFGAVHLTFNAPKAEAYLFSFVSLRSHDAKWAQLPERLIPVPYDVKSEKPDADFVRHEQERIAKGQGLPPEKHSIFNLEPTQAALVGTGNVDLPQLAPGSYMLLVRAQGRLETRVPFRVDRASTVKEAIELPAPDEVPPGFFYMAGGNVLVGGTTAGAWAPHAVHVPPALIYHDEISMAEYGEFLRDLVKSGRGAEAQKRVPRDFGKPLALLTGNGELLPADHSDPQAFAHSPVRGVSFRDASAYVEWRSRKDGYAYRLPHDSEWEAACRGADGRTYSWGDQPGKGLAVVTQGYGDTGAGISWRWEDYKDESPYGIHNLAGGAAEWTDSSFSPGSLPSDPVYGQYTIRGNAWSLPPTGLECAFRTSGQPDYFHPTIGFRIALDYPPVRSSNTAGAGHAHAHR